MSVLSLTDQRRTEGNDTFVRPVWLPATETAAAGPAAAGPGDGAGNCRAATRFGRVQGLAEGAVCGYLGVPYAAPPTGQRRFRPPAPPARWAGTLPATTPKPGCPQDLSGSGAGTEDCLYTRIWQPRSAPGAPRPVLVFLHTARSLVERAQADLRRLLAS